MITPLHDFLIFDLMIIDVQANLSAPRLIPPDPKIYNRVLTSVALRELELVAIEEQTPRSDH